MFAIVECKGFQYHVSPNELVKVPLLAEEPGSAYVLDHVLLVADGAATRVGTPTVTGAKVTASIVRHGRADKIVVGKFKKRKDYRRRKGHRQYFTELRIESIVG